MSTPIPTLNTNTGVGAITAAPSHSSTIHLTGAGPYTSTTHITAFTGLPTTYPIVSRFPVRVTQSGVVYISTATITLNPASSTPSSFFTSKSSGANKGAIAGGVIGALAVIFAIVATLLWFRRRSPAHWKARTTRGWKNLGGSKPPLLPTETERNFTASSEDKPKFPEPFKSQDENPFKDPVVHEAPPPALYIREPRQPAHNPFADPPESPTSPRPTHKRGTSSVNPLLPSNN